MNMANLEQMKRAETNIRRRVDCEETAFHLVNKLIDGNVDGAYLSECGKFLCRENYEDIVEERAISKLCGYPVCDQALPDVPKKKYHISTKTNKVYDISERKNFCSNQCFKASKYFQSQIREVPIWSREEEEPETIAVSPHKGIRGMVGDEVIGTQLKEVLKDEVERLEELDKITGKMNKSLERKASSKKEIDPVAIETNKPSNSMEQDLLVKEKEKPVVCPNSYEGLEQSIIRDIENGFSRVSFNDDEKVESPSCSVESRLSPSINENKTNTTSKPDSKLDQLQKLMNRRKNILSNMVDLQDSESSCASKSHTTSQPTEKSREEEPKPKHKSVSQPSKYRIEKQNRKSSHSPPLTPLNSICNILKRWMSISTVEYLDYKLLKAGVPEPVDELSSGLSELEIDCDPMKDNLDEKKKELSRFLGDGIVEELDKEGRTDLSQLKSVPDYKKLKEESKQLELKVTEFLTGKPVEVETESKNQERETDQVYIPKVDAFDQTQIRARIVLEKLDKSLPSILVPMNLSVQDVSTLIREIVYTFRLERDTILFKPAEWTLVSLILMKMLSQKVRSIAEAFQKKSAVQYFTVLLGAIQHTVKDLEGVTADILAVASVPFGSHDH